MTTPKLTPVDVARVVVDASPLIGLAKAARFGVLQQLFCKVTCKVTVTEAVRDEVRAGHNLPGSAELEAAVDAGWLEIVTTSPSPIFADLGAGEAATLTYASETNALVLMDDKAGRLRARTHRLDVVTIIGVLIAAKRKGFVDAIGPLFDLMREQDFYLSDKDIEDALDQVGETRETGARRLARHGVNGRDPKAL